jgi:hypothetical protein
LGLCFGEHATELDGVRARQPRQRTPTLGNFKTDAKCSVGADFFAHQKRISTKRRLERLVVDANFVYALPLATQRARASRFDIDTGTEEIIVPSIDVAHGFDVAAGYFYFTEENTHSIQKVPVEGGESTIVASFTGRPQKVIGNGNVIYATLNDVDPQTNRDSTHVIRLNDDGSEGCVVGNTWGSSYDPGDLVLYEGSAFYTGQCGTDGTK